MKNWVLRIFSGGIALTSGIIFSLTHIFEDSMIISSGIHAVRTIRTLSLVVMIPAIIVFGIDIVLSILKKKKETERKMQQHAQYEEELRELDRKLENENAILKSGRMDPVKVKGILEDSMYNLSKSNFDIDKSNGTPLESLRDSLTAKSNLLSILNGIKEQMNSMDSCQVRLHSLLEINGASKLKDSEEVLDGAEQMLCQNVRKVINIIAAGASNKENEELATTIFNANEAILEKSNSFVVQLAKYLNSQDSSSNNINVLDSYRDAITEVLKNNNV